MPQTEKLEILVQARDQASAVLKGVAGNLRGELKAVEGASAGLASTSSRMAGTTVAGFGQMRGSAKGFTSQLNATRLVMAGVAVAAVGMATKFIEKAAEAEAVATKLRVAIAASGQGINQKALEELATHLGEVTTFSKEAVEGMEAFLVGAHLNQEQIERLSPAIIDMATYLGTDLTSAAKAIGMALKRNSTMPLMRLKLAVDKAKFALDPLGAILDAIKGKAGNLGEAAGRDAGGQLAIFTHQVEQLEIALGTMLLPTLKLVVPLMKDLAKAATAIAQVPGVSQVVSGGMLLAGGLAVAGLVGGPLAKGAKGAAAVGKWALTRAGVLEAAAPVAEGVAEGAAVGFGARALGLLGGPIGATAVVAGTAATIAGPPLARWREARQEDAITARARAFVARRRAAGLLIPGEPFTGPPLQEPARVAPPTGPEPTPQQQYESFLRGQGWVLPAPAPAPAKITNTAPNVAVSQAANNDLLIRVQMPEVPQGLVDDYTNEYLEDVSYAEEE